MTLVPEYRTPESDEALRLIGAIAIESARLEWALAGLCAALDPSSRSQWSLLKRPNDRNIKDALRWLRQRDGTWAFPEQAEQAIGLCIGSKEVLKRRGDLMHSPWVMGRESEVPGIYTQHNKSGSRQPVDVEELHGLLRDIKQHAGGLFASALMVGFHNPPRDQRPQ